MPRTWPAIGVAAALVALIAAAGCGNASSSTDASHNRQASAPAPTGKAASLVPGPTKRQSAPEAPSHSSKKSGGAQPGASVPLGVPLDANSAAVRRAIAGLLHSNNGGNGNGAGGENNHGNGHDQSQDPLGILGQLRHAAQERLEQVTKPKPHQHRAQQGGPLHILEMLR